MENSGCVAIAVNSFRSPNVIACGPSYLILTAVERLLDGEVEFLVVSGGDEPPAVIWGEEHGFIPEQYPIWLFSMLQHRLVSTGSLEAIAPFPGDGLGDGGDGNDDDGDDAPDPSDVVNGLLNEPTLCGK